MSSRQGYRDMRTQTYWPDRWKGPWCVSLYWLPIAGRFECVGFAVELDEKLAPDIHLERRLITAQLIRSIPVGRLIEETRQRTGRDAASLADGYESHGDAESARQERELADQFKAVGTQGGRPRMYPDAHYRDVARVYAVAWQSGSSPTKSVEELYHVSHSTAARWVHEARQRSFLGPTDKRKAGGILPPEPKEGE